MADNTIANAIKFLKGEEKSLPATKTEGQVYFAYKNVGTAEKPSYTGAIYIDTPIGGTQNRIKMTANADIADKAFNDSAGLNIRDTYLSSLGYTDDGKQTILIKGSGNNQTRIALPIASTTKSGIVTTDAQSFGGTKTFTTINSTNLTVSGSSGFNYTGIETATGDKARPVWFAYDGINGKPVVNTNFTYNPVTQTLSVANLSGTADKANKDNAGDNIRNTYIKNITVNGTTLTFTKGSGATSSITLQDNNNAVTQTAIKSSDYTYWRTVLWGASNSVTEGFTPTTVTDGAFTSDTLTFQPSSGTLKAKIFKGSLLGNASTATTASKAINDGSNQNIANTYVKYKSMKFSATADKVYLLEGNGAGSVTATSGSNISTAIIPAATDKTAGVITTAAQTFSGDKTFNNSIIVNDCLVSKTIAGTDKSRFIILPRVPFSMIDSTHDTSIYFKELLKWICANYPNKKDYSFIGLANPNTESNVLIHIYDTGTINKEGYPEYSTGLFKYLGGALCTFGTVSYNYYCRDTLMTDNNFAGSASSGGAATSANKLNINAGSATQPIYFSGGIPVACSNSLGVNITGAAGSLADATGGGNIKVGWNGAGLTSSKIHSLAAYSTDAVLIKDAPKSAVREWLGSMPASDVYSWAKASSKPSYSWGEITGKPSTFTPSSHNHTLIAEVASGSAVPGKASDGFIEFYYNVNNGSTNNMPSDNNANAIISLSRHAGDYSSQLGFSSNGNIYYRDGVGATAWRTVLDSSNYTSYTVTKSGSGASGTWGINITGSAGSVAWGNVSGKPSSFTPSSHTHPYLPLSGGTMTGTINFNGDTLACNFRSNASGYCTGIMHQTNGNEALMFAAANAVTSFIFKCGQNPVGMTSSTWTGITPSMQIKKQSVYINSLIANNVTPGYNLYVNGTTRCNGTLGVGNGSSAEIDFFPNSSSTIGARIKAYSDRIEFVFS